MDTPDILIRTATPEDAADIWKLVTGCAELDSNSFYAYAVLCNHFGSTCVVAEVKGAIVAFVTGFISPAKPDTCFVWQLYVSQVCRGKGLASVMIDHLIAVQPQLPRFVEATVAPDNERSRRTFKALARRHNTGIEEHVFLGAGDFPPGEAHDPEHLLRVGPLR